MSNLSAAIASVQFYFIRPTFLYLRLPQFPSISTAPTMAIHKDYPGLKVEIVVNDKALPEHEDPDLESEPNEVITYVEAEAGAEFAIRIYYDQTFRWDQDVGEDAWVDGQVIKKQYSSKKLLGRESTKYLRGAERVIAGQATEQTLCFGELKISELLSCDDTSMRRADNEIQRTMLHKARLRVP